MVLWFLALLAAAALAWLALVASGAMGATTSLITVAWCSIGLSFVLRTRRRTRAGPHAKN
jgi:hypothetical protein